MRDEDQTHKHTFNIDGFEEFESYHSASSSCGSKTFLFFNILTVLGFGLPFAFLIERNIARYDIGLLKRLTV
jgi:hypothetical protein